MIPVLAVQSNPIAEVMLRSFSLISELYGERFSALLVPNTHRM
jgi:hypothetical protein